MDATQIALLQSTLTGVLTTAIPVILAVFAAFWGFRKTFSLVRGAAK